MNGIQILGELQRREDPPPVILLTSLNHGDVILKAMHGGARGYLLKDSSMTTILQSVRLVHQGGIALHPEVTAYLLGNANAANEIDPLEVPLTPRETEILEMLAEGLVKKEMADRMGLSYHTVDGYFRTLYQKLEVSSKSQAVAEGLRRKLIPVGAGLV